MHCSNYENCVNREKGQLGYPIDKESLYVNKIYDNQTANRRCYTKSPIEIIEGFGFPMTLESLLKMVVIILLVALFVILIKDSLFPKEQVTVGIANPTEFNISSPKL